MVPFLAALTSFQIISISPSDFLASCFWLSALHLHIQQARLDTEMDFLCWCRGQTLSPKATSLGIVRWSSVWRKWGRALHVGFML
jgi:hypothetical protein